MVNWFVEKENKIPLYLQLKDLIKYYISTGAIKYGEQLPGVNELAADLIINFDTVRKAYKELEKEGLVSMKRGIGTFVNLHETSPQDIKHEVSFEIDPLEASKVLIRRFLRNGVGLSDIRNVIDRAISEISKDISNQYVIFSECNTLQVEEISRELKEYLNLKVKPVLIKNLKQELHSTSNDKSELLAIITTGFHINEVQSLLENRPLDVYMLVTNMSPETRRKLDVYNDKVNYGFICRDHKSIPFYTDLMRSELDGNIVFSSCVLKETRKVKAIMDSVEVLLVTPPVYSDIKKQAPKDLPIFNVFDRIDPMSLRIVKDNLFQKHHILGLDK